MINQIPFNADMVRAMLCGRKTQTRRIKRGSNQHYKIGQHYYVQEPLRQQNPYSWVYEADSKALPSIQPIEWLDANKHKTTIIAKKMPRHLARFIIEITSFKNEPLQSISTKDCMAEGILYSRNNQTTHFYNYLLNDYSFNSPQESFGSLINKIYGSGTWERNPQVQVIEFKLQK